MPTTLSETGLLILALAISYFVGAIPFGFLFAKYIKGVDLREHGSRNIGATNTSRVVGRPLGLLAFALDFGKGWLPVSVFAPLYHRLAGHDSEATFVYNVWGGEGEFLSCISSSNTPLSLWPAVLCGAAAVCGHVWPIYLRFKGGKAVATGCGALTALDPFVFLGGGAAWIVTLLFSGYFGLASMIMGVSFPILAWVFARDGRYGSEVVFGAAALAFLILLRHRANMKRMLAGEEPKFRFRRGSKPSASA